MKDILRFPRSIFRRFIWRTRRPPLPINPDGTVLLHIGCGHLNDLRFINIDLQPYPNVHFLADGKHLQFTNLSVDLIYASHVLEHFSHLEVASVLSEWSRVLRKNGRLFVSVPDLDALILLYHSEHQDMNSIIKLLMGSQGNRFDFHRCMFNRISLSKALIDAGFFQIEEWDENDYAEFPFNDYAHMPETNRISINFKARKM